MCVEGPVGGGKTAFLNAINGNLNRISGYIHLENVDDGWSHVILLACRISMGLLF